MNDGNGSLKINDLYAAAALLSEGIKLVDTRRANNGRVAFIFQDEAAQKMVDSFFRGELQVNARSFTNSIKNLKTIIYQR